ncbi:hypothetical protein [Kutzneria kofuensis]|uniref:Uncharacterized protein n=1 Tax=Kutzneria kofuensis TaxID=103725 RepID=A0A7W9NL55_9PSEU|nr:hypothetical protein [Kutzneria kofuensis]
MRIPHTPTRSRHRSCRRILDRGTIVGMDEEGRDDLLWMTYGDLTLHFYATPHLVVCEIGDATPEPSGSAPQPRA